MGAVLASVGPMHELRPTVSWLLCREFPLRSGLGGATDFSLRCHFARRQESFQAGNVFVFRLDGAFEARNILH
jgi:hypothetical protein